MAGVVFEVVFVVWEFREGLHDFRRGIIHAPEKPSIWLLVIGLFGSSLVAIGVTGEFWEEAKIEGVETQIRSANDGLYLLLSKEAGALKGELAQAEAKAASAEKAQQNVEVKLNKQKVMAATAETDLIKLQQRLNWRVIGADQREKLVQHLMDGPKGTIEIEYPGDDQEALHFAGLLRDVLKDAKWPPIKGGKPQAMIADSNTGLGVIVHGPEDTPAYAAFLQKTFVSEGLPCNGLYSEKRSPGDVVLSVGHKDTGP